MNKNLKQQNEKTRGITLVALVVTIVVLLILAGITINLLFSNNGIIKQAQDAKNAWENSEKTDQEGMANLSNQIDNILNSINGGNSGSTPPLVDVSTLTSIQTSKVEAQDSNGNKIVVPKGFKVLTSQATTVQKGIVIQDEDGNQFVWVPVGTIKNADGTTNTIELARYTFNEDGSIATKNTEATADVESFKELDGTNTTYVNTKAINIEEFKTSVAKNGGYYIGRYEASYRSGTSSSDYIPYVVPSQGTPYTISLDEPIPEVVEVSYTSKQLWNWITQPEAAAASRNMYKANDSITSDLTNSYAWDTALVYIQTYSGISNYSRQPIKETTIRNTGSTGGIVEADKVCNIYDMDANMWEWSTETYIGETYGAEGNHCSLRGAYYTGSGTYPCIRDYTSTTYQYNDMSFRPVLYL